MMKEKNKLSIFLNVAIIILLICVLVFASFIFYNKVFDDSTCGIKASAGDNFVFLGDSITYYYPIEELYDNLPVINSGVSGYTTVDILDNIDDMVSIYNPTKVILLIGTNDIKQGRDNKEIANNIKKIVNKILEKRPNTKIYIESVYPINDTDDEKINHDSVSTRTNKTIKDLNKKIKKYCKDNNYTYINMYDELTDKDGNLDLKYTKEGLHISDTGYLKITKVMYRVLGE